MKNDTRCFLTVIGWPGGFSELERAQSLVESAGMDLYQAKLASRRNTPGIMRELETAYRDRVLKAMHARGVLSVAPSQLEIDAYPEAEEAVSVDQFPDADPARFVVEPRNGEPWTFTSDQVWLVVAGRLRTTKVTIEAPETQSYGGYGGQSQIVGEPTRGPARASRQIRVRPVIDLHIRADRGQRLVRLIGPRTRIGIVGDDSRPSLLDNTQPLELIEALMPNARIDREFLDFDPPPSLRRLANKRGGDSNIEKPEYFGFYSAWIGIIMRTIYG
jgi:hypothetical protein